MGYYEIRLQCDYENKEVLIALLNSYDALGFIDHDDTLITYFRDIRGVDFIKDLIHELRHVINQNIKIEYTYISERDWNETWKKRFQPIDIGENLTIIPPWQGRVEGRINVIIDPAMAFGTGHHETTQRCLFLIEGFKDKTSKECFMDLGTGSGILAVTASLLGFKRVFAIDNDILAIDAIKRNISANNLSNVTVIHGDISEVKGLYDMVVGNLVLNVIKDNINVISCIVKDDGFLIISGLIDGQEGEVIGLMENEGMGVLDIFQDGRWSTIVFKKNTGG